MPKVVMLVRNAVANDNRVLRAATALAEAGYAVTVIGQVDKDHQAAREVLASGVEVIRVTLRTPLTWFADLTRRRPAGAGGQGSGAADSGPVDGEEDRRATGVHGTPGEPPGS